ncbi:MAG: 23S rRNA (adenine(1618)-N(6))-methyltransferase RlmF [Bacteroidetes bacterium]|nr:23S rRNA (adenine(1618)-N(6))-methyltransferase RlmF [Bacteroidota bacterium]
MPQPKREHPQEKSNLHPRSKHRGRYDFAALTASCPALTPFVRKNDYGDLSIDFFDPEAVRVLNQAILKHFYGIDSWDIPANYLCPPIPGRADYLHYAADLLAGTSRGQIVPTGSAIRCLDIGVGASCIYPILGRVEYGWSFVGADIDPVALASARQIVEANAATLGNIELRLQENPKDIFAGIIRPGERFDLVVCNPPFHASAEEARASTLRKLSNLKHKKITKPTLNFGGQASELWCEGGEERFVADMIRQSRQFATSCFWFTTLISKESHLKNAYTALQRARAMDVRTIDMGQGNKVSRVLAWTYLGQQEQKAWIEAR